MRSLSDDLQSKEADLVSLRSDVARLESEREHASRRHEQEVAALKKSAEEASEAQEAEFTRLAEKLDADVERMCQTASHPVCH